MQNLRWHLAPTLVVLFALALLVAALPLAYWQPDEFHVGRLFLDSGIAAYLERVSEWSPRPISEFVLYLYMSVVDWIGRPMVGAFVGLHWLVAGMAIGLVAWIAEKRDRWTVLILGFGLLALPAFGPRSSEPYFWAQAVVAYLPTFAVLIVVTLAVVSRDVQGRAMWVWLHGLLALATLFSEVGMMVALCAVPALLAGEWLFRSGDRAFKTAVSGLTFLIGLTVLYGLIQGRVALETELLGDAAIAGNLFRSLASASIRFVLEALSISPNVTLGTSLGLGLAIKALVALSVFLSPPGSTGPRAAVMAGLMGVAFVIAAWGSVLAGYYQFGLVCCDRHGVFRYLALVLAAVCFGKAAAAVWRTRLEIHPAVAPLSFAAAVALPLGFGLPLLAADIGRTEEFMSTTELNWANARVAGDTLNWLVVAPGHAVTGTSPTLIPGYFAGDDVPTPNRFVMEYFGKVQIDVRWASPRS